MPRSGLPRVFVCALAFVSMKTLFNSFSAGPCVPALCVLHTASPPPALASVRLVYPIARGSSDARGAPCAWRPAPRPLWPRPSGPSPRRPVVGRAQHPPFSLVKLGISRQTARMLRLSLVYCNTKDNPLQTSGFPIKFEGASNLVPETVKRP